MLKNWTVWREGLGSTYTQANYVVGKANFGQNAGSVVGARGNAAVPEPAAIARAILAAVVL